MKQPVYIAGKQRRPDEVLDAAFVAAMDPRYVANLIRNQKARQLADWEKPHAPAA